MAAPPKPWWRRIFSGDEPPTTALRRQHFHPMGLTFRSRAPETLFFPTVHARRDAARHGGFDHTLYAQGCAGGDWEESERTPHANTVHRARGVLAEGSVKRRKMQGELPNRDVIVPAWEGPPPWLTSTWAAARSGPTLARPGAVALFIAALAGACFSASFVGAPAGLFVWLTPLVFPSGR